MTDERQPLTRCQRWTLESLAVMAPTKANGTTVHELAAAQRQSAHQTGVYLGELHTLRLVQYRTFAGGLLWWVNDAGLALVEPDPSELDQQCERR